MARRIQLRRDTTANWTSADPILAAGEVGVDLTTGQIKIGDGTSNWSQLLYYSESSVDLTDYATTEYVDNAIIDNNLDIGALPDSLIPDTDVAYDLGSPTKRFRDLYLSGNTIDLGGATISVENGAIQSSIGFAGGLTNSRSTNGITQLVTSVGIVQPQDAEGNYLSLAGAISATLEGTIPPGYTNIQIVGTLDDGEYTPFVLNESVDFNITGTTVNFVNPLPNNIALFLGVTTTYGNTFNFAPGQYGPFLNTNLVFSLSGDFNEERTEATFEYTLYANGFLETVTIVDPGSDYLLEGGDNRILYLSPENYDLDPILIRSISSIGLSGPPGDFRPGLTAWTPGQYTATGVIGGSTVSVTYTVGNKTIGSTEFVNQYVIGNSVTQTTPIEIGTSIGLLYIESNNPTVLLTNSDPSNLVYPLVSISLNTNLNTLPSFSYNVGPVIVDNTFTGSYLDLTNKPTIPADISDLTDTQGLLGQGGSSDRIQYSQGQGEDLVEHDALFAGESDFDFRIRLNTQEAAENQTVWGFKTDGTLTFPDNTTQSSAWNPDSIDWAAIVGPTIQANGLPVGTRFTQPAPLSSLGQPGDTAGTVAFNSGYIYYCIQNYSGPAPVSMTVLASSGTAVWVDSSQYTGDLVADFTANSTGWTYNGVVITNIQVDNQFGPGYVLLAATNWSVNNTSSYNLQAPGVANIWKRVAWSNETW